MKFLREMLSMAINSVSSVPGFALAAKHFIAKKHARDILARSHNRHHNVNAVLTSGQRLNPPWFEDRNSIEVGPCIYGHPAFRDRGTGQNAIARTYWRISAGMLYTLYHTQRSPRGHLRPVFVRHETQTRDFTREMQSPLLCFVLGLSAGR